ncbi:hypothetical protein NW762_008835 [Fusarium torreyae]|uniref:Uncharacterized protein n=1 Tax=Fusarium torreyae TaxID=1237075 RepID=A0A9W8VBQ1_9HYPO|nr:hypothetical protein NW762_008835 [Fusarium torreyae]
MIQIGELSDGDVHLFTVRKNGYKPRGLNLQDISKGNGAQSHDSGQGTFSGTIDDAYQAMWKSLGGRLNDRIVVSWRRDREENCSHPVKRRRTTDLISLGQGLHNTQGGDVESDTLLRRIAEDTEPTIHDIPPDITLHQDEPDTGNGKCGNCRQAGQESPKDIE